MTSRITIGMIAIALVSAGACKGKSEDQGKGSGTAKTKGPKPVSTKGPPGTLVLSSHVVALEKETNLFVAIDAKGALSVGVVPAKDRDDGPWASQPAADYDELRGRYEHLRSGQAQFRDEDALLELLTPSDEAQPGEIAWANGDENDPPPPEPEEEDDEEPGDPGAMLALDEGKMGERRADDEPRTRPLPATDEQYVGAGAAAIAPLEVRQALPGMVQKTAQDHHSVVLVADAAARAAWLFPTVSRLGATAIAVRGADGKVGRSPLRLNIESARGTYEAQTERLVDLTMDGVIVRSGPGALHGKVAWSGESVDSDAVAAGWQAAAEREPDRKDVFVSVAEAVTVARLMSVIDALIGAGAEEITLRDWTRPELHGAYMIVSGISSVGDLDRKLIRETLEPQLAAMRTCYADAVANDPKLEGELTMQFTISPEGEVIDDNHFKGVSKAVGACVAKLVAGVTFPKPPGGGVVQAQIHLSFTNLP